MQLHERAMDVFRHKQLWLLVPCETIEPAHPAPISHTFQMHMIMLDDLRVVGRVNKVAVGYSCMRER
jgi:hypothetical protein